MARTLWHEGYDDHLAGHITYRQPDGTLLCNPWLLLWEELRPDDLLVIDLDGNRLEGRWPVPLGIPLHLELHRQRHDVVVAVHSHPRYGTTWADLGRVPGCYDQSSALGGGELVVVDEYDGPVDSRDSAARAVASMGSADMALLANHGVFVTAGSIRAAISGRWPSSTAAAGPGTSRPSVRGASSPARPGTSSGLPTARGSWDSSRPWPGASCGGTRSPSSRGSPTPHPEGRVGRPDEPSPAGARFGEVCETHGSVATGPGRWRGHPSQGERDARCRHPGWSLGARPGG